MTAADTCAAHGINSQMPRRYPLNPVADLFPGHSLRAICDQLKISGSTYEAYICHGILPKTAERIASRLGVPTYYLWPEMVDDLIAEAEVPCSECGDGFVPNRKGHRFCSPRCAKRNRQRDWQRRRYQADPAFRQLVRARSALHYREVQGYRTRQMREYRQRNRESAA